MEGPSSLKETVSPERVHTGRPTAFRHFVRPEILLASDLHLAEGLLFPSLQVSPDLSPDPKPLNVQPTLTAHHPHSPWQSSFSFSGLTLGYSSTLPDTHVTVYSLGTAVLLDYPSIPSALLMPLTPGWAPPDLVEEITANLADVEGVEEVLERVMDISETSLYNLPPRVRVYDALAGTLYFQQLQQVQDLFRVGCGEGDAKVLAKWPALLYHLSMLFRRCDRQTVVAWKGLYMRQSEMVKYQPDTQGLWQDCVSLSRSRESAIKQCVLPPPEGLDSLIPVLIEIQVYTAVDLRVWPGYPSKEELVLRPFVQYTVLEVTDNMGQEQGHWHIKLREDRSVLDCIGDAFQPTITEGQCFWKAEDPVTQTWIPYPPGISEQIEKAFTKRENDVFLLNLYGEASTVDFEKMRCYDTTGHSVRVDRVDTTITCAEMSQQLSSLETRAAQMRPEQRLYEEEMLKDVVRRVEAKAVKEGQTRAIQDTIEKIREESQLHHQWAVEDAVNVGIVEWAYEKDFYLPNSSRWSLLSGFVLILFGLFLSLLLLLAPPAPSAEGRTTYRPEELRTVMETDGSLGLLMRSVATHGKEDPVLACYGLGSLWQMATNASAGQLAVLSREAIPIAMDTVAHYKDQPLIVTNGLGLVMSVSGNVTANASGPGILHEPAGCRDNPWNWTNHMGENCCQYSANQWCTADGGYGPGWDYPRWGSFANWTDKGVAVNKGCCACGGGIHWDAYTVRTSISQRLIQEVLVEPPTNHSMKNSCALHALQVSNTSYPVPNGTMLCAPTSWTQLWAQCAVLGTASTCPGTGTSVFVLLVFGLTVAALTLGLFYMVAQDNKHFGKHNAENRQGTVLAKVLLGHLQVLGMFSQVDLPWPSGVAPMLGAIDSVVNLNLRLSPVECLYTPQLTSYVLFYIVAPFAAFVLLLVACGARWVYRERRGRPKYFWEPLVTGTTVVVFLTYPTLLRYCAAVFVCKTSAVGTHLVRDPDFQCHTDQHRSWMAVAGVFLGLFALVAPLRVLQAVGFPRCWGAPHAP